MKTTVDIPDNILQDLIENTAARTKKEAIITAIEDYNRRKKIAQLSNVIGTFEQFITPDDIDRSRKSS
ncbi:MAG: type II toxin-antitoxin system VapB family antitoxin [Spirochaetales bacterium]|jgi:hypothetical protein|nr:type II toxin-antitoxin system VapB family antitoxin [Spirochaetales bacterium]